MRKYIEETNIEVHAILLDLQGNVILQQREDDPNIINPGMITMFGGTIKKDEELIDGLERELLEEIKCTELMLK